jgi:hypothetical protein
VSTSGVVSSTAERASRLIRSGPITSSVGRRFTVGAGGGRDGAAAQHRAESREEFAREKVFGR